LGLFEAVGPTVGRNELIAWAPTNSVKDNVLEHT
jgi:hypothetical protein